MNNRSKLVGALVGLLLLLLAGWWLWTSRQVKPPEATTSSSANAVASNGTVKLPNASNAQPASASAPTPTPVDPKVAKMEARVAAENATPIDVYGKVIDQFGQPVIDAKVNAGTLLIKGFDRSGGEEFSTVTDTQGRFSFTGLHGARFGLGFERLGYEYDPKRYVGWWDSYKPDPDNPMVFHMWKLQGAEPMVHTSIQAGLACDGTPRKFDPLTGRRDAGYLVATLTRNPVNIDPGKPFDWTLTLEIAGGGLIPINDLYPDEAPADGYQSSVAINMPSDAKNWTPSVVLSYYIFDGKNYGRITINIMANYQPPPTHFEIDSYVNPAGSRNLEFDPAKQVR
jgi:hypothetical protein